MDLTTTARTKAFYALGGESLGEGLDAAIALLVTKYSIAAAKLMDRHTQATERTEQYDIEAGQRVVSLKGYPVDTTADFEVTSDAQREFTGSAEDSSDYHVDAASGLLHLDGFVPAEGYGVLEVVYTGGMGTDVDDFIVNYPDIAHAIDEQIVHLLQRKDSMGATAVSVAGGSISHAGAVQWLPHVKTLLLSESRDSF